LTAVYGQDGGFIAIWIVMFFGFIGYALKRLDISILPFVIGFLLKSPLALVFIAASLLILALANRQTAK
jgi:TctA family transporter